MTDATVTASDWIKGISLSVLASIIGGASKLAIRKSWLIQQAEAEAPLEEEQQEETGLSSPPSEPLERVMDDSQTLRYRPTRSTEEEAVHAEQVDDDSSPIQNNDDDESPHAHRRHHHNNTNCIAYTLRGSGMIGMTFLNPLCSVLAMNYASPSILAPFSGLTLVWIVLLSHPLIGERPSTRQVIAASLIILGEVVVAFFGDHTNDEGVTLSDIDKSYLYTPFLLYFGVMIAWMLLCGYWMRYAQSRTIRKFAWGVSGGSITGLQNFLKDSLTILKAVKANHHHIPWYLPLMVFLAVGTAFGGLLLLTACMKRYDATYSAAMFVGSFVVSASIMSVIHYNTFQHVAGFHLILYPTGLAILIAGVFLLIQDTKTSVVEEQEEQEDSLRDATESSSRNQVAVTLQEPLVSTEPSGTIMA